jgi:RNA polymerase sigma-70 factor (ECF subfamily)
MAEGSGSEAEPARGPAPAADFAELYRRTVAPLRRYLTRLLGNPGEAQDVAHDAYLRVYPTISRQQATEPTGLLYLTARRLAINRLKHRGVAAAAHQALSLDPAGAAPAGVPQQIVLRQELGLLAEAIARLPPGCRAVLLLRSLELRSHREIADQLGIAVSTVEKQHARALRLLRAALTAAADRRPLPSAHPSP